MSGAHVGHDLAGSGPRKFSDTLTLCVRHNPDCISRAPADPARSRRPRRCGLSFSDADALRALEAITRQRPDIVAIESLFATTSHRASASSTAWRCRSTGIRRCSSISRPSARKSSRRRSCARTSASGCRCRRQAPDTLRRHRGVGLVRDSQGRAAVPGGHRIPQRGPGGGQRLHEGAQGLPATGVDRDPLFP